MTTRVPAHPHSICVAARDVASGLANTRQEKAPLTRIARERGSPLELRPRLGVVPKSAQEVTPHIWQQVVLTKAG